MRIFDYLIEKFSIKHRRVNRAIDRALRDALDSKNPEEDLQYINDMSKKIELTDREMEKVRVIDTLRFRNDVEDIVGRIEKKLKEYHDKLNNLHSRMKDIEILTKGESKYQE